MLILSDAITNILEYIVFGVRMVNSSVICLVQHIVDFSISENGYGNSEITLLFFGSDRAAAYLSSQNM